LSFALVVSNFILFSGYVVFVFFFFFSSRRRHTRFSRDWSSDVCSSDLLCRFGRRARIAAGRLTRPCVPSWLTDSDRNTLTVRTIAPERWESTDDSRHRLA